MTTTLNLHLPLAVVASEYNKVCISIYTKDGWWIGIYDLEGFNAETSRKARVAFTGAEYFSTEMKAREFLVEMKK